MRQLFITLNIAAMTAINSVNAQEIRFSQLKSIEHLLEDVMEITDTTELKTKLSAVELSYSLHPNEINKARVGIIYHETALNLSFFSQTTYKGYAKKSFDILSELFNSPETTTELMPFVASYQASALSLVSAETRKLSQLSEAFDLFNEAVEKYADVSYLPEFLRGSVSENLPWFFFSKRNYAKHDFGSIITKQENNTDYANRKIMSFTYWAWAKQHQSKKYRQQALKYLDRAIMIDPDNKAGRSKAEVLRLKLI